MYRIVGLSKPVPFLKVEKFEFEITKFDSKFDVESKISTQIHSKFDSSNSLIQ